MATKNYLSLEGLTTYDGLIKQYIGAEDAKSIKSISVSGNTVSFYKTEDATGTAAYTVNIPDVSGFMDKIASATGGKIVTSTSGGQVAESSTAISDLATNAFVGTIPATASATTVTEYAKEVADSKDADISAAHDAADAAQGDVDTLKLYVGEIPSTSSAGTVTSYVGELSHYVGEIPNTSSASDVVGYVEEITSSISDDLSNLDQSLAAVAKSGDAGDVSYDNTVSGWSDLNSSNVQNAIDELDLNIQNAIGNIEISFNELGDAAYANRAVDPITRTTTDIGLVSAKQLAAYVASEIAGLEGAMHFVGVITRNAGETDAQAIARVVTNPEAGDVVVMSDNAKEYIYVNSTVGWREVGDETEFVKKTTTIAGVDLADNITKSEMLTALNVEDGAEVNIIESVKVNGSALTPDSNRAVNVTVAEGSTNGTVAVNGSDVTVHGLGSAAYTASTAYDASGAAATAKSEVIGTSSDAASASTIYGAKAYADAATGSIATADINALFTS